MTDSRARTGRRNMAPARSLLITGLIAAALAVTTGCGTKVEQRAQTPPPRDLFHGPEYLHGTIGSITQINGAEPIVVSNYGLIAGLKETGSADVPPYLRQKFINDMRRLGHRSPAAWLARMDTALVKVRGVIPPGAVKGQRFDLMVEALPQTQTTSLKDGRLWTLELSVGGANPQMRDLHPVAFGRGPVYVDPTIERPGEEIAPTQHLRAVVLSGGVVTADRKLQLVLNYPSWDMARIVADRINERFGHERATEFFNTAVPKNYQIIDLNIPAAYAGKAPEFVELIRHLYYHRGTNFEVQKAAELARVLVADHEQAQSVVLAWEALGKRTLPVLRQFYRHDAIPVRMAALEAGARLGDEAASAYLEPLAKSEDPNIRHAVARIFENLPTSFVGARVLMRLVDDDDRAVRLRAYETLAANSDPRIERYAFGNADEFKFVLDLIPSEKPLVYVVHDRMPRVAIFGPRMMLRTPLVARLWENNLLLKVDEPNGELQVYYQEPGHVEGKVYTIQPLVAEFAGFIAHRSTVDYPAPGLDLSFSSVVDALYELKQAGYLRSELQIEPSTLAQIIDRYEQKEYGAIRAETEFSPAGDEVGGFMSLPRLADPPAEEELLVDPNAPPLTPVDPFEKMPMPADPTLVGDPAAPRPGETGRIGGNGRFRSLPPPRRDTE